MTLKDKFEKMLDVEEIIVDENETRNNVLEELINEELEIYIDDHNDLIIDNPTKADMACVLDFLYEERIKNAALSGYISELKKFIEKFGHLELEIDGEDNGKQKKIG